jgi:hypothetical protein
MEIEESRAIFIQSSDQRELADPRDGPYQEAIASNHAASRVLGIDVLRLSSCFLDAVSAAGASSVAR